jgi:hypothetical protein
MSVDAEFRVRRTLIEALSAKEAVRAAQEHERKRVVMFVDEALASHWSWPQIGRSLGVSATGARRYYERNRRKVRGVREE